MIFIPHKNDFRFFLCANRILNQCVVDSFCNAKVENHFYLKNIKPTCDCWTAVSRRSRLALLEEQKVN